MIGDLLKRDLLGSIYYCTTNLWGLSLLYMYMRLIYCKITAWYITKLRLCTNKHAFHVSKPSSYKMFEKFILIYFYVNKDEIWPLFSCNCITFTNVMPGGWIRSRNRINICAGTSSGVRTAYGVASASEKIIRLRPGSDQSKISGSDRIRIGSTTRKEGTKFTKQIITCLPV